MTLRHMKIFAATFRNGSITQAAKELNLAQPSVSLAVKELEQYYGIRLFERIGRKISPTESGREFYGYAVHIVTLFEEMEKRMKNWDALGTIRIGTSITIGTHILPGLIRRYEQKYPDLTVEAVVSKSADIERYIREGTADIGLIENNPEHPDIVTVPFMKDTLCAIAAPNHPLSSCETVTLEQLAQYPFLMREKGSAGREMLDAAFEIRQMKVRPAWESSSTQAIVKAVSEGLGVAVLPSLLVERDVRERTVVLLPFQKPLRRDLNIIYHRSKYLTPNMKAFMRLCHKIGQEMDAQKTNK